MRAIRHSIPVMNKTALITGASRGIGRGIALELASTGWDLLLNYASNHEAARRTVADCIDGATARGKTISALTCQADVSNAADRERLLDFARSKTDRLDLLVSNAGVGPTVRADLLDVGEASFDRLIAINVKGPFFLTQAVARWMVDQVGIRGASDPAARGAADAYRPKIVIVSSISAYTASVNRGDYCVSKAGLSMLTPLFAARLASHGIPVFEIRPGIVATDMTAAVQEKYDNLIAQGVTPIRRWGQPADVAKAVLAIAQDLFPFSTGEVFNVDGGFHLRTL